MASRYLPWLRTIPGLRARTVRTDCSTCSEETGSRASTSWGDSSQAREGEEVGPATSRDLLTERPNPPTNLTTPGKINLNVVFKMLHRPQLQALQWVRSSQGATSEQWLRGPSSPGNQQWLRSSPGSGHQLRVQRSSALRQHSSVREQHQLLHLA